MNFCKTIYPNLQVATKVSEVFLGYITSIESDLMEALSKIITKE